MKILFLEDDTAVSALVKEELESCGLTVTTTSTVADALREVASTKFDVAIVDVGLPDGSGLDVLHAIRASGHATHVLVLSGAASEHDRLKAFDLSADDYVVKPFYVSELCSRVMAVTRRLRSDGDPMVRFGERLAINLAAREVLVHGEPVELTDNEFDLLAFLATRAGHVFSRAELLRSLGVPDGRRQRDDSITKSVYGLRKKIEDDRRLPRIVQTVRGGGYRFDPPGRLPRLTPVMVGPGTLVHDGKQILFADETTTRVLGYASPEDLVGQCALELVAPLSRASLESRFDRLASGATVAPQQFELVRTNGATVHVEVATSETRWNGAKAWRVVITPVASEVDQLLRLATGVVTHIPDAVIVTDMTGYVRGWNLAAERRYGWSPEAAVGRHLVDIVPWVVGGAEFESTWSAIGERGQWHGGVRQQCRDRSVIEVLASASQVLDEGGRRRGVVFTFRSSHHLPSENLPAPDAEELADLRRGIENDEFVAHYQPLVDLHDGAIIGLEVLARWQHPTKGLVAADAFVGIAEQSGLINELGGVVRRKALTQLALWIAAGHEVHVGINLSARELSDPRLVESVTAAMVEDQLPPGSVWFEVTETALVEDLVMAGVALDGLVRAGARISIDDFGTGWGSLVYLRNFPVHALKIDQAFVRGLPDVLEDVAICRSVISLGAELGLSVVAEGVETASQRDALTALGCRVGQGYFFGKAMAAEDVTFERAQHEMVDVVPAESSHASRGRGLLPRARRSMKRAKTIEVVESDVKSVSRVVPEGALADARHEFLWAASSADVEDATIRFVRALGGEVLLADDLAAKDGLPVNLAFAGGPPLLAVSRRDSVPRMLLERHLPALVADAERAMALFVRAENLWRDASGDALTGIANRRYLDRAVARAHPGDGLAMIDLDHFKELNDRKGHLVADEVLRCFGSLLREEVRADDLAGRFGGDEFLLLLREPADPAAVCARLRDRWIERRPSPVTFSAGWALVERGAAPAAALELADRSLYRAKSAGRDCTFGALDSTLPT